MKTRSIVQSPRKMVTGLLRQQERPTLMLFFGYKNAGDKRSSNFREVNKIDPGAAVIIMTGYTEEDLVKRAVSHGAYTCIYKPFDAERVIALVEDIARERKE